MRKSLTAGGLIAATLLMASPAMASVTVVFSNSNPQSTTGSTGFQTNGAMMAGMTFTATFADGSVEQAIWGTTGADSGAASVLGMFSLSEAGDTFSSSDPWTLTNLYSSSLVNLFIDAGTGDTVFDTDFGGSAGTDGSARGRTFSTADDLGLEITATYSGPVALTASAPVGDVYRYLNIDLGTGLGRSLSFSQDTDNFVFSGDIRPVPLPAALPLFATALAGLSAAGLIRRKKSA